MSSQKIINPGFGIGSAYGTPLTVAVAQTSTVALTSNSTTTVIPTGWSIIAGGMAAGISIVGVSTTNGVTGTWTIMSGATAGPIWSDGASLSVVNTTTSVALTVIPLS